MNSKNLLPLIIVLIAVSIMIYSCGSSDSNKINTSEVALHEHAFKDDPNLYAQFSHVTVLELEHAQESNVHEKDSGSPGVDIIPYIVRKGGNHTFEFEDIGNGDHYAILRNENEIEVARMDPDENIVTVYLLAGKYKFYLYNMGTETFPLFLQPITADAGSSRQASFNPIELALFLLSHECRDCNLYNAFLPYLFLRAANLAHANLSYANLSHTDLWSANLFKVDLSYANLTYAELSYADMRYVKLFKANLSKAKLIGTNLSNSVLEAANLEGANLSTADMRGVDLTDANLTDANLTDANLTAANLGGANLSGVTWTDGTTICKEGSIGRCIN